MSGADCARVVRTALPGAVALSLIGAPLAAGPPPAGTVARIGYLAGRLPAMLSFREYVEAGGRMSYGPDLADLFRRSATYVDKILKGARPGDLPPLLQRADRVIDR